MSCAFVSHFESPGLSNDAHITHAEPGERQRNSQKGCLVHANERLDRRGRRPKRDCLWGVTTRHKGRVKTCVWHSPAIVSHHQRRGRQLQLQWPPAGQPSALLSFSLRNFSPLLLFRAETGGGEEFAKDRYLRSGAVDLLFRSFIEAAMSSAKNA